MATPTSVKLQAQTPKHAAQLLLPLFQKSPYRAFTLEELSKQVELDPGPEPETTPEERSKRKMQAVIRHLKSLCRDRGQLLLRFDNGYKVAGVEDSKTVASYIERQIDACSRKAGDVLTLIRLAEMHDLCPRSDVKHLRDYLSRVF